jgi:hypothetical protein
MALLARNPGLRQKCRLACGSRNAVVHKFDLRILNWFLIEKMAFGRHGLRGSRCFLYAGSLFGRTFQENIGKRTSRIAEAQDRVT